jgi:hypothetical protein
MAGAASTSSSKTESKSANSNHSVAHAPIANGGAPRQRNPVIASGKSFLGSLLPGSRRPAAAAVRSAGASPLPASSSSSSPASSDSASIRLPLQALLPPEHPHHLHVARKRGSSGGTKRSGSEKTLSAGSNAAPAASSGSSVTDGHPPADSASSSAPTPLPLDSAHAASTPAHLLAELEVLHLAPRPFDVEQLHSAKQHLLPTPAPSSVSSTGSNSEVDTGLRPEPVTDSNPSNFLLSSAGVSSLADEPVGPLPELESEEERSIYLELKQTDVVLPSRIRAQYALEKRIGRYEGNGCLLRCADLLRCLTVLSFCLETHRGGFAVVYRVRHRTTGKREALKVIHKGKVIKKDRLRVKSSPSVGLVETSLSLVHLFVSIAD